MRHYAVVYLLLLGILMFRSGESLNLVNISTSKIVGNAMGTGTQHLPQSYVQSFDQWQAVKENEYTDNFTLVKKRSPNIYGREPLALPSASQSVMIRPSLQVLIKSGIPSYILAGIEFSSDDAFDTDADDDPYLSMTTVAQQWITFAMAVEPNFRIMLYQGEGDGTDDLLTTVSSDEVLRVLELLASQILQLPVAQQEWSQGFHILSLPLFSDQNDGHGSSSTSSWIKVSNTPGEDSLITCLATAETDAREILTLDPDLAEMTVSSILQIPLPKEVKA
eukprot:CAMPEP_0198136420 /NCGR_PEP_ID=MMETSP1443-20131203/70_1 /TAXON_ID=186043 /ORGANISM="Entomoneis sp., Strain CCMP2396" /LENGTH=277 /DNA_ID=CAMNT_0043797635 /DNA_START=146 /DNA_END=979 /DNA_ORIENTATION=-